ncbi:MAG: hypothetical protein H5U17_12325 [Defluviimonas sp.]|nr:hypothetical protein [Defluviimonas sp.]
MSDPMTKIEIEDVLSSIRRLVSEDLNVPQGAGPASVSAPARPMPDVAAPPPASAEREGSATADGPGESSFPDQQMDTGAAETGRGGADRAAAEESSPDPLVLTPALRVAQPDSASLRASLEDTIAELEAAISGSGSGDDWESCGGEMPEAAAEPDAEEAEPDADSEAGGPADAMSGPDQAGTADEPAAADRAIRLVSEPGEARPEPPWSQYSETLEWAAPGDASDEEAGTAAEGEDLTAEGERAEGLDLAPEAPEALPGGGLATEADQPGRFWAADAEDAEEPASLEEAAAAPVPELRGGPSSGTGPGRLHLAGGHGGGAVAQSSAASGAWAIGEPDASDILEAEEDDDDMFGEGEDAILDEAALRALVSEIIMQELRGSLGKRIGRNVRKLVRREIERALAARDLG